MQVPNGSELHTAKCLVLRYVTFTTIKKEKRPCSPVCCFEGAGTMVQGGGGNIVGGWCRVKGNKGEKNWDNCNSIINKIY